MTTTSVEEETFAERRRLADLLAGLEPKQWAADSLCAGWRVREVVAHITMPFRTKPVPFVIGMVRAGFKFDRYADRLAHRDTASMTDDQLLSSLRDNITHPWRPPGGGQVGALSHDVIHGLDLTEPLGLPAAPPSRIALVLGSVGPRNLRYFGTRLDHRFVATDADISLGSGPELRLPAKEILLRIAARRSPL